MTNRISRRLSQVCHQDASGPVGADLQHNSQLLARVAWVWRCVCLGLLLAGSAQAAEPFEAMVLRVVDGDTLWVLPQAAATPRDSAVPVTPARRLKLRIEGIDAPEICQAHGLAAQRFLERSVLHATIRVQVLGDDRYRRQLAEVFTLDGVDLAALMVREGQAWSYRTGWKRGRYAAEENQARKAGAGLFADPKPQYPRAFRVAHGPCHTVSRQPPMPGH